MINFQDYFYYDLTSPSGLRWKIDRNVKNQYKKEFTRKGDIAGSVYNERYYYTSLLGKKYLVHRIICNIHNIDIENLVVDHIDGNTLNNNIDNLRVVTTRVNTQNMKKHKTNTTNVTGVSLETKNGEVVGVRASCYDMDKHLTKYFSVKKYGFNMAFELACKARENMILKLTEQGHSYSERHGK